MRKWLAILGLLILTGGAWSQVPRDGSKQHDDAQDKQKTADPTKPVVVVDSQHGANNQEQASEKPAKYPWGELLAPANIPNWFLVIVGGVTGWFVYKTLRAIKKQADIMETQAKDVRDSSAEATRIALATAKAARKAADAADISAKAAIGVAIPTLVVDRFSFINTGRENPVAFYSQPRVRLALKNYGKSPAFLRKYSIGYAWGEGAPNKFTWYPFEDQVIDGGATYELTEVDLGVLDSPSEGVIGDLVSGKRKLVFLGWISYRDVFDSPTRKLHICRELTVYDSDSSEMTVMDTSASALKLWTDPNED